MELDEGKVNKELTELLERRRTMSDTGRPPLISELKKILQKHSEPPPEVKPPSLVNNDKADTLDT